MNPALTIVILILAALAIFLVARAVLPWVWWWREAKESWLAAKLQRLTEAHFRPIDLALRRAVFHGSVQEAAALLDTGADPNTADPIQAEPARDRNGTVRKDFSPQTCGRSLLDYAVMLHKPNMAELLLNRGAAIDAQDATGETPLMRAVLQNDPAMVQLLLRRGANVNIRDRHGETALTLALEFEGSPIAQWLREAGAHE